MSFFIRKILFPILTFMSVFIIILHFIDNYQDTTTSVNYTLKAYKNTVALYNGEEIVKIYSNVVLNTLPEKDIQSFNNGISVATPSHAETLLEDYDS